MCPKIDLKVFRLIGTISTFDIPSYTPPRIKGRATIFWCFLLQCFSKNIGKTGENSRKKLDGRQKIVVGGRARPKYRRPFIRVGVYQKLKNGSYPSDSDRQSTVSSSHSEEERRQQGILVRNAIYSNRPNVNLIHEVFRQAFLLPFIKIDKCHEKEKPIRIRCGNYFENFQRRKSVKFRKIETF